MHFVVKKGAMEKALKNVSVSVQHKSIMPVLSCVKIIAGADKLAMTTTNLDMETSDGVPCKVVSDGVVVAPLQTVLGIVQEMPSGADIDFKLKNDGGDVLIVSSGKRVYEIVCMNVGEFPDVLGGHYDIDIPINAKVLHSALKKISFAMSQALERHNLNSIHVSSEEEDGKCYLCCVATDGHRLGFSRIPLGESISLSGKLLPRRAVAEMIKLIDIDSPCTLGFSANKARIKIGDMYFATKLVDATFPDYKKVVPQNNTKVLEVQVDVLASEIRAMAVVTQGKGVKLVAKSAVLQLEGVGPDGSKTSTEMPCSFVGADDFVTTYNPSFVEDVLKAVDKDKNGLIRFHFGDTNSPSMVQSVVSKDAYYVIMPMKTE